ncbi:MAG: VanW family protein [bacterium]|nr:VanW family protein [bacterium]
MFTILISILFTVMTQFTHLQATKSQEQVLAYHEFSLNKRYENKEVNKIFKDNILLTLRYARGEQINPAKIDWRQIGKPFQTKLVLTPGETFAFHDDVLPEYGGKVNKTMNAHFNSSEGFKSDGYLVGDGVCHLASLLYWVAQDAGLDPQAPTRHDFAPVPEVPQKYGVSIYSGLGKNSSSQVQNLYISNTKNKPIAFVFDYDGSKLAIKAVD